jgi:hypothetical protein
MKAEKRHQLHTNILADRMGRLLQGMKTAPTSTSILVWVFVVLAGATFAVWQFASSMTQSNSSELWTKVDAATHELNEFKAAQDLKELGDDNRGSIAGRAALFQLARKKFQDAQANLSSFDRAKAIDKMNEARTLYEGLAGECVDAPLLAQEALMMVAAADESLVGITTPDDPKTDLQRALESYEKLAKKFPGSIRGEQAAARVQELKAASERAEEGKLSDIEQFYAELNRRSATRMQPLEPKPELPKEPKPEPKTESNLGPKTGLPADPKQTPPKTTPTAEPKKAEPTTESKPDSKTKK